MKRSLSFILLVVLYAGFLNIPDTSAATWLQPPSGWGSFLSSANFSAWPADDFRFDSETAVERVDWWSVGAIADMPVADGFYVRFYSNYYDADLGISIADELLYEVFIPGNAHQTQDGDHSHYYAELSTPFLAIGGRPYWVSIQGDFTNDPDDDYWWGWAMSSTHNRNPAEYNSPTYNHRPINEFHSSYYDLAFELHGSPVPVPGAVWLLGSGLCGLVTICKKRKR